MAGLQPSQQDMSTHSDLFRIVLDYIDSRIALFSLDGQLIFANKLFYDMLGLERGREINFTHPDWLHPDDFEVYRESLEVAISEGESESEYRCYTLNGELINMYARNILMRDNTHRPNLIVSITHDITNFKQREYEILNSRNLFETLIENIPTGVFVKDASTGQYIIWNKICEKIYSLPKEEAVGKTDVELFPNDTAKRFMIKDDEVVKKGLFGEYEEILLTPSGNSYNLIKVKIPFKLKSKNNMIIGILRDVTSERNQERELRQAREKALESDRLKTAFLANMSHEIRTPLNSILGFSDLMDNPNTSELDKKTYLSIIRNNGKRLLSLINDIIDISKIECKQLEINKNMINVNSIIRTLHSTFELQKGKLNKPRVKIFFSIPLPDSEAVLNTDQIRFEQIYTNLLNNALKFTDSGYIEFGYKVVKDSMTFYVTDSGRGIKKEDIESIFNRFRTSRNGKTAQTGAGLGLTISKELVELLGGKIWVESEINEGSTFYFSLPYSKEDRLPTEPRVNNQGQSIKTECCRWAEYKILITEDNEDVRFYLESLLKPTCINITFAETGSEAVKLCNENEFDLILMDIDLPEMDGKEAFKLIHKKHPEVPVIAETAYAMVGDEENLRKLGFADYLSKPFSKEQLLTSMNGFLNTEVKD